MSGDKIRINLIGLAGSGKSTVVQFLKDELGFDVYRPSDTLREYARARNITLSSRQDYVNLHKTLHEIDPTAMVDPVINSTSKRLAIDGLRAPGNEEFLKQQVGMITLVLACPDDIRYERVVSRQEEEGSSRDSSKIKTFEQFLSDESADSSDDPSLPNAKAVMENADVTFDSSQPIEDLTEEIKNYIAKL